MSSDPYRGGILKDDINKIVLNYTSSISHDNEIKQYVVDIIKAHVVILYEKNLIKLKEAKSILNALLELNNFELNSLAEDVHANLEAFLISKVGPELAGNVNLAKSRNDQVSTAIRMALREKIVKIMNELLSLKETMLNKSSEFVDTIMPGYTHLQHAQPITLAHHLLAHYDRLNRDFERLFELYKRVNLSPMGSGALATSSFQIDRNEEALMLGFSGVIENSIDAVSSRDFALEALFDFSLIMTDLSSIAEEFVLWCTSEFNFVQLPDEFVSTSSIMPQKRNPIVAEMVRAKTGSVYGNLFSALTILKALPLSYNLDFQELTPHVWSSCEIVASSLLVIKEMLLKAKFNTSKMYEEANDGVSTATELSNLLVRHGLPFRASHKIVGDFLRSQKDEVSPKLFCDYLKQNLNTNIGLQEIEDCFNVKKVVESYNLVGGPAPEEVKRAIEKRREKLSKQVNEVKTLANSLLDYKKLLEKKVDELLASS
ncbi:MAG: argininosuccinate lyase [Thaumarchaeota archaeon]|nr:argininosuccinate lyase [Nitrososphaerota archaeon]